MTKCEVFIAPGHGRRGDGVFDPGASSHGFIEHDEAGRTCDALALSLTRNKIAFHYETGWAKHLDPDYVGSTRTVNRLHESHPELKLALEIHFNAGCHEARGCGGTEALYVSKSGLRFAELCVKYISAGLHIKSRGAKQRTDLYFLNDTHIPACIPEVCFVDSPTDRTKFNPIHAAEAISHAICEYLGHAYAGTS